MSSQSTHVTAFVLSLIGGVVIVLASVFDVISFFSSPYGFSGLWGMMGMMGGYYGFGYGYNTGLFFGLSVAALVSGIIVLVGAILMNIRPMERTAWGIVVLIFSLVSFLGGGGYFIGAILGIAGGAVALSYRTQTTAQRQQISS